MGHFVEREVAKSSRSQDLETIRARQAHYIKWCQAKSISDPVGPQKGWDMILAIYVKYVMLGVNYKNLSSMRSATCKGYVLDAGKLFVLRGYPNPIDFTDANNWPSIIVNNLEKEEDIASQRSPLDDKIFTELLRMSEKAGRDSLEAVVFNCIASGKPTGPRASKYSQTNQDKVDVHEYPSGKKVIKAWIDCDIKHFDCNTRLLQLKSDSDLEKVQSMIVEWRHQKNRQNGQKLRVVADKKNPKICPVCNMAELRLRKRRLNHSLDLPLAVYAQRSGEVKYLTASKIAEIMRKAVRKIYPDMPDEEVKKFSAHSTRVWACVLLDEAGMSPDFIKKRLRWLGESYRVYLRDTKKINQQHKEALQESAQAVMDLYEADLDNSLIDVTDDDREIREYDGND